MLRKLLVPVLLILASIQPALAKNKLVQTKSSYRVPAKAHYKGEIGSPKRAIYKGEIAEPLPPPAPVEFPPCKTYTFNPGFYLGIGPSVFTNYSKLSLANYKGLGPTAFLGYTLIANEFYFAAEVFISDGLELQNYTIAVNANGNVVGLKSTLQGGLSLLPGYVIADTLLGYLRVGTVTTHFKDLAITKTGAQVGVGIEGTVSESWDLRAEYVYSFYPTLPVFGNVRTDEFRLGVVYKIDP